MFEKEPVGSEQWTTLGAVDLAGESEPLIWKLAPSPLNRKHRVFQP